jgi:hypothetical protein
MMIVVVGDAIFVHACSFVAVLAQWQSIALVMQGSRVQSSQAAKIFFDGRDH